MPRRDGTGPVGFGPGSGRGFGYCRLNANRVYRNDAYQPYFDYTEKADTAHTSEITGLEKRIDSLESKICAILEKLDQR